MEPSVANLPECRVKKISRYICSLLLLTMLTEMAASQQNLSVKKYAVSLPASLGELNDAMLQIDYTGDTGMGFIDSELVTDEFNKFIPLQIELRKFYPNAARKEMLFYFRSLQKEATYLP